MVVLYKVKMGKVQNGHLYIRCKSSSQKNNAVVFVGTKMLAAVEGLIPDLLPFVHLVVEVGGGCGVLIPRCATG